MKHRSLRERGGAVLLVALSTVGPAPVHGSDSAGLVVHEWGTFTSIAGVDGAAIQWRPLSGPSDLPCFVRGLSGGMSNIEYLASLQLASPRLCTAHCVWVDERERRVLAEHDVKVMHCPSSNLKLGSGIAPVAEMRTDGITVSLGADGAACNNHLDMFEEMRLAALLQATRLGPGALTARDALGMATRAGARTLGLEHEIGSIQPGKRADLIVIDRDRPHLLPGPDPYSTIVYAARATDVRTTIVDGDVLFDAFTPTRMDGQEIAAAASAAARELAARARV